MGQYPKVIGAMVETVIRMGTGAGGTRNIAGTINGICDLARQEDDLSRCRLFLENFDGYVRHLSQCFAIGA
jgi:5-aminolevulinate synthase